MGLSVSHGCWSGPCSSFTEWRVAVARAAGFPPLAMMEGYFRNYTLPTSLFLGEDIFESSAWFIAIGAEKIPAQSSMSLSPAMRRAVRDLPISWKPLEHDPLVVLLTHSDCDGSVAHKDCAPIAKRLREIAATMVVTPSDERSYVTVVPEYWRSITEEFANGLMKAHELGEDVTFAA